MPKSAHREIIFDMRCLQDENYRIRGVGRVAEAVLVHARQAVAHHGECRLTGLVAHDLPELSPEHRIAVDGIRYSAPRDPARGTVFVNLSPMTHDPLFVARLVNSSAVFSAAVCFDFIPLLEPDRYLPGEAHRLGYSLSMYWLGRHRFFAPISEATAEELGEHFSVGPSEIATIGAPLDPTFGACRPIAAKRSSVLVVGGGDNRKNVECALRAHAQSAMFRRERIGIVVTGNYTARWRDELADYYKAAGGQPGLLTFAGHVSQEAIVELYQRAFCVVCMSRAEGFSLPLIEAMACGTPVVASDIPAHRELIKLPQYLLPCEADSAVCQRLESLWRDKRAAALFTETHHDVWRKFTAQKVGGRFWAAVLGQVEAPVYAAAPVTRSPAVSRQRQPRIAFMTPLPPARSGVADYTASCLKELARQADVTVYTNTPSPTPIEGVRSIRPLSAFAHLSPDHDRVVSVLGNSHFHLDVFHHLMRYGGACVEHDNRLLSFYSMLLGKDRAERIAANELRRPLKRGEIDRWLADESTLEATLLGEVAAVSEPLILHSAGTAQLVRDRFGIAPSVLPFAIYRQWAEADFTPARKLQARERLGISPSEVVIVSFGYVHYSKAPNECIASLELLRSWGVPAKLYFVGAAPWGESEYTGYARKLGVTDSVKFVNEYTSEATYRDYLLAADLGVQLRTHLLGGLSGALLDCIAVGLPTVANVDLAHAMEAPSYVARVNDRLSPVLIANAWAGLAEQYGGGVRPHEERRSFTATHNFTVYADRLCEALSLAPRRRANAA